jgi:hypothetical protein
MKDVDLRASSKALIKNHKNTKLYIDGTSLERAQRILL